MKYWQKTKVAVCSWSRECFLFLSFWATHSPWRAMQPTRTQHTLWTIFLKHIEVQKDRSCGRTPVVDSVFAVCSASTQRTRQRKWDVHKNCKNKRTGVYRKCMFVLFFCLFCFPQVSVWLTSPSLSSRSYVHSLTIKLLICTTSCYFDDISDIK